MRVPLGNSQDETLEAAGMVETPDVTGRDSRTGQLS